MNDPTQQPTSPAEEKPPLPSNNDLATQRTDLATQRTDLATQRTELAAERNDLAEIRTALARERTRAAEERTLMAWIRTALSMISFGFGIDRLFKYVAITEAGAGINMLTEERILGLSLMSLGLFTLVAAIISHWRILKNIETEKYEYTPGWSQGLTVAVVLLFVGLAAFIPLALSGVALADVFTLDSRVIQTLTALTIFLLMLTLGVKTSLGGLGSLWQQPGLVGRSLLSALVLFPLGTAGLGALFLRGLPEAAAIGLGLAALAASPGAPLLTQRASMAGGNLAIATSLQVTLATLAVITTPLTLLLSTLIFAQVQASTDFLVIAKQVLTVQLLPLGLGILIRTLGGVMATDIGDLLTTVANTLFVVLLVFLLGFSLVTIPTVPWRGLAVIPFLVGFGLVCGHLLGGPDLPTQSSIATGTIARNAGLALFLVAANGAGSAIPTIIAYMVVGAISALPYNIWVRRQQRTTLAPG
ncbi:MAG: DUF202 domain-containing protein [Nodosilinea sp.]